MEDVKGIILDEPKDEKEELGVEEVEIPTEEPTVEEDSVVEEAEDTESAEAEVTEEAEEAESEESTEGEEVADEETVEEDGDEVEDDEAEEIEDADEEELAIVTELQEQIQTLTNRINELAEANKNLKKTNKRLSAKYQNELDKKQKFKDSLKGLSVELLPDEDKKPTEEKVKVMDRNYVRDGIGEL